MYLLLFKHPKNDWVLQTCDDGQIAAYSQFGDLIDKFKGFISGWTSPSWAGGTISMMNIQPKAIEFNEDASKLTPYILSEKIVNMTQFGMSGIIKGAHIKSEIMEGRKVIDIWKETMIRGGIYDSTKSDLLGKQGELELVT